MANKQFARRLCQYLVQTFHGLLKIFGKVMKVWPFGSHKSPGKPTHNQVPNNCVTVIHQDGDRSRGMSRSLQNFCSNAELVQS